MSTHPVDPRVGATSSANRPPTPQAGLADPATTIRFSADQLAEVRRKRSEGISLGALAKAYGVSRAAIQRAEKRA